MAGPIRIAILANGRQARGEIGKTTGTLGKLDSLASKAGRALKTGLVFGGAAAAAGLVSVTKAASEAQQSLGATESVFGKYADTVTRRSKQAAEALGLSANEYRELSNVTGAMLASSGMPMKRVTDLTASLQERAADVAATFGGSTREAVEAFNAMLRGETDPVERYGVAVKQVDINARLAAKGQDKLTGSAKKQAEATARLDLLFEQTAKSAGQFGRESDTFAGQSQRLTATLDDLQAKVGSALLPALTDLVQWTRREVVPALEDGAQWFSRNREEIGDLARTVGGTALGALKDLASVAKTVVEGVKAIPGPVREVGVQAAVAALVLPRLTAGVTAVTGSLTLNIARLKQWRAEMTYAETRAQRVATTMQRLGGAARTAAGVGGMVALTQASQTSNVALGALGKAAGGALLGFSVGGPIGAAIGAGVGGLWGLHGAIRANTTTSYEARTATGSYKDTLDQLTGAATRATRAEVLRAAQADGILGLASRLDVSTQDLIGSVLGQEGATRRLNRAQRQNIGLLNGSEQADWNTWIRENTNALGNEQQELRESNRQLNGRKRALKGMPKDLRTRIKNLGAEASMKEIRELARRYKMSPKRLLTRIELAGVNVTGKNLREIQKRLRETGNTRPGDKWLQFWLGDLNLGKTAASRGGRNMADNLRKETGRARPNLSPFAQVFNGAVNNLRGDASSGGRDIGSNLGSGINSGVSSWVGAIASSAASLVGAAIAAARSRARIQSPSREMAYLGEMMGEGLVVGLTARERRARESGRRLVSSVIDDAERAATRHYQPGAKGLQAYRSVGGRAGNGTLTEGDVALIAAAVRDGAYAGTAAGVPDAARTHARREMGAERRWRDSQEANRD